MSVPKYVQLARDLELNSREFTDLTEWLHEKRIPMDEMHLYLKKLIMDEIAK